MFRNVLILSGAVLLTGTSATAQTFGSHFSTNGLYPHTGPVFLGPTRDIPHQAVPARQYRLTEWQADQLVRWGDVGKCVAAKDQATSLSYIGARRGSPAAAAAARRLEPTFDSCFAGSGIAGRGNKAFRRAAIADALGMKPA